MDYNILIGFGCIITVSILSMICCLCFRKSCDACGDIICNSCYEMCQYYDNKIYSILKPVKKENNPV